jgi:multisubunit Na+/H+ antiporter MnhF subunit
MWLIAAAGLMLCLIPCGIAVVRGAPAERLVAVQLAGIVTTLVLVLMAQGTHRASFADLAIVLALLSFGGGLTFARFLEHWV